MATSNAANSTYNFWNRYRNIYGEPWREVKDVLDTLEGKAQPMYEISTPTTVAPTTIEAYPEEYVDRSVQPRVYSSPTQSTDSSQAYTVSAQPVTYAAPTYSTPTYSPTANNTTSGALDELNAYNLANIGYLLKPMSDYSEQDMQSAQGALSSGLSGSGVADVGKWKLRDSEKIARMQLGQQMLEPYLQRQQGIDLAKISANADTYRQVLAGEQAMQQLKLQESGLLQRQTQKERADLEQQVLVGKQAMERLKTQGEYDNAIALINANANLQRQIMQNASNQQVAWMNNQTEIQKANIANPLATPSQSKATSDIVNKYANTVNPNASVTRTATPTTGTSQLFFGSDNSVKGYTPPTINQTSPVSYSQESSIAPFPNYPVSTDYSNTAISDWLNSANVPGSGQGMYANTSAYPYSYELPTGYNYASSYYEPTNYGW